MASPIPLPRAADLDLDDIPYVEGMSISCMPPAAEYYQDPFWYDSGGRDPLVQREIFKLPADEERTRRLRGIVDEYRLYGPMLYELAAERGRADIIRLLHELGANPHVKRARAGNGSSGTSPADDNRESERDTRNSQEDTRTPSNGGTTTDEVEDEAKDINGQSTDADISSGNNDTSKAGDASLQDHSEGDETSMKDDTDVLDESDDEPMLTLHPPLTGAAFAGQLECAQVLLEEVKVSIDEWDDNGPSIAFAAAGGHADVVKLLLSRGAAIATKAGSPDVLSLALKGGSIDAVKAILESEQWKTSECEVTIEHLPFAGHGGNSEAVELILSLCGLPSPTGNIGDLRADQSTSITTALTQATAKSALTCLHPLLSYVTHRRSDGSYEYFEGPEHFEISFFNATDDATEVADNPELFRLAWDTVLRRPNAGPDDIMARTPCDAGGKPNLTLHEALHRQLIAAASYGRVETVKLIHEHYGADVNFVSHKFSSTCLSRASGQGLRDLQNRLSVGRYLLESTNADLSIAHGDFANGTTPLACAMQEGQPEMIRLLLEFGGPVESIDEKVYSRVKSCESGEQVKICVAYFRSRPRHDVRVMRKKACEKAAEEESVSHVMLEWERDELLSILARLKMRVSDDELQKADPKGRPLAGAV